MFIMDSRLQADHARRTSCVGDGKHCKEAFAVKILRFYLLKSNENFKGLTTESLMTDANGLAQIRPSISSSSTRIEPAATEEALEGYYLLGADFIRSFGGPLQALAFTPVILLVYEDINNQWDKPAM